MRDTAFYALMRDDLILLRMGGIPTQNFIGISFVKTLEKSPKSDKNVR